MDLDPEPLLVALRRRAVKVQRDGLMVARQAGKREKLNTLDPTPLSRSYDYYFRSADSLQGPEPLRLNSFSSMGRAGLEPATLCLKGRYSTY